VTNYSLPLPNLSLDIDHISIKTTQDHEGEFTIKNTGGGTLEGHILSRSPAITFTPQSFTGNSQIISYTFDPKMAATSIESMVYITSNGGEVALPLTAQNTPMTIQTEEGQLITSTQDFFDYAAQHPNAARRLFTTSEFYMLLLSTGYKHMEIYEHLHKDVNRERAMDNFFVLSGLKSKTELTLPKQRIDIVAPPNDKVYERFYVQKSDSGYTETPVFTANSAPWVTLATDRLVSSDYDHENKATVGFSIDPLLITGQFAHEVIQVGNQALDLTLRKATPLIIRLNREGFRYDDRGSINVINNTGYEMRLEVFCRDRYVHFYSRNYVIGASFSVPFDIKPSALASTRRLFKKIPYISTYIDVKAQCYGQSYHERLHLNIGEW